MTTRPPRSLRMRLLLTVGLCAGVVVGCATPVGIPPQFRFTCETDEDCQVIVDEENADMYQERCISGLCQYPCTGSVLAPVEGECPDDFIGCFNGVCSNLCETATKQCPSPQTCIIQDVPDELAGQLPIDLTESGVCGIRCDEAGAPDCPDGQFCIEGACFGFSDFTGGSDTSTGGSTGTDTDTDTGGGA